MYTVDLNDTASMMASKDYKVRFIAEYIQLKIRCMKLHDTLVRFRANKLISTPACDYGLLEQQYRSMSDYLEILEIRAETDDIDLPKAELLVSHELLGISEAAE